MLARAATAVGGTPGPTDLRGWHYVLTGAILLHVSPYGFEEMRGRYAWTQDSYERCRGGLDRLEMVLRAWERLPQRILSAPDDPSRALALAAGGVLGIPVEPWQQDRRGLIVTYDLAGLPGALLGELSRHDEGTVLFSHATCWTLPTRLFAADLTTYLYQSNAAPWADRPKMGEPQKVERIPADPGPPEVWAERILAARSDLGDAGGADDDVDRVEPLLALSGRVRDQAAAFRAEGPRELLWFGGTCGEREVRVAMTDAGSPRLGSPQLRRGGLRLRRAIRRRVVPQAARPRPPRVARRAVRGRSTDRGPWLRSRARGGLAHRPRRHVGGDRSLPRDDRGRAAAHPSVEYRVGDLISLSAATNEFGAVVAFYCIIHLQPDGAPAGFRGDEAGPSSRRPRARLVPRGVRGPALGRVVGPRRRPRLPLP